MLGITAFLAACQNAGTGGAKTATATDPNQPLPSMAHTTIPLPDLPAMFRLGEVLDFPAEVVHVARVTKAAFSAAP